MKKSIIIAITVMAMFSSSCATTGDVPSGDYSSADELLGVEKVEKDSVLKSCGNALVGVVAIPYVIVYTIFNPGWMNGQ